MYHLYHAGRKEYVVAVMLQGRGATSYTLQYNPNPIGCRWSTARSTERCLERLVKSHSLPENHELIVVYVGHDRPRK